MNQNGVTDMGTAKSIARKLFATYTYGGQEYIDKSSMERMMVDTYKILVHKYLYFRTKTTVQLRKMWGSITKY